MTPSDHRLSSLQAAWRDLKGEVVVVVAGRDDAQDDIDDTVLADMLRAEMDGQRLRDAVTGVVAATGCAKNRVYRLALEIAKETPQTEDKTESH